MQTRDIDTSVFKTNRTHRRSLQVTATETHRTHPRSHNSRSYPLTCSRRPKLLGLAGIFRLKSELVVWLQWACSGLLECRSRTDSIRFQQSTLYRCRRSTQALLPLTLAEDKRGCETRTRLCARPRAREGSRELKEQFCGPTPSTISAS